MFEEIDMDDAKSNDLQVLHEVKNHIDKYGVSEETISLFSSDLAQLGISKDTSKEVAIECIEDIIHQNNNDVEGSEEGFMTNVTS